MKSDIGTIISIDKLLSKYKKFIGKKPNHAFIGFLVSKSSCEVRSVCFFSKDYFACSCSHLQGFECLGMVIISTSINGTHCMDLVSRCNGTLILITNESELGNLKSDHETFDIVRVPSKSTLKN